MNKLRLSLSLSLLGSSLIFTRYILDPINLEINEFSKDCSTKVLSIHNNDRILWTNVEIWYHDTYTPAFPINHYYFLRRSIILHKKPERSSTAKI